MAQANGWIVKIKRASGSDMWEFRRNIEQADGTIKLKKQIVCSLADYPTRENAEKSKEVAKLRLGLNGGPSMLLSSLLAHYKKHGMGHLAYSTKQRLDCYLRQIENRWGSEQVMKITTKQIQVWLDDLKLAPQTKAKFRNTLCTLYSHAIKQEFFGTNPMTGEQISYNPVRGPYKRAGVYLGNVRRLRKPDVLTTKELQAGLKVLALKERVAVRLANLGLRRSEIRGLQWQDFDFIVNQVTIMRSVVDAVTSKPKTEASAESVKLDETTKQDVLLWLKETLYKSSGDFVFSAHHGVSLDMTAMLRRHIIPVFEKIAPSKTVGWHTFRHTFTTRVTKLVSKDNMKTAQALLRHASIKTTMDLYAQADEELKQAAVDALAITLATEMVQ